MDKIRHRRLYAFLHSKVLNLQMIILIVFLLITDATESLLLPVVCGTIALLCFLGYSFWLWFKKPKVIVINSWLSSMSGWLTLYFMFIAALKPDNVWYFIVPVAAAIIIAFVSMIRDTDEIFEI